MWRRVSMILTIDVGRAPVRCICSNTLYMRSVRVLLCCPLLLAAADFRFIAGPGKEAAYTGETGSGFDLGYAVTCAERVCTSDRPFFFSVKLPEGNYNVTVTLGDPAAAAVTTV